MGIGKTTYNVLLFGDYIDHPQAAAKTVWESGRKNIAANGGIMRTSVVGLLPDNIGDIARNICRLAHYDPRCVVHV